MATVAVVTPKPATTGADPRRGGRSVTLRAGALSLTLPVTSPESDLDGIGVDFALIPRSQDFPLMRKTALRRPTINLDVLWFPQAGHTVESMILTLARMSNAQSDIGVAYGPWERARRWKLTQIGTIHSQRRAPVTHAILEAHGSLTFTAVVGEPVRLSTVKATPTTAKKTPRYVIANGRDRLTAIAARETGNASNYKQIAKDNGIRNPGWIVPAGTRLKITV